MCWKGGREGEKKGGREGEREGERGRKEGMEGGLGREIRKGEECITGRDRGKWTYLQFPIQFRRYCCRRRRQNGSVLLDRNKARFCY